MPESITDLISTVVINFGLSEDPHYWSHMYVARPFIRYMSAMGYQMIKLNKHGFICITCDRPYELCSCDVAPPPSEGFPDFQFNLCCPCCQSYSLCQCMYRYVDYGFGDFVLCEWNPVTWEIYLKLRYAAAVLWYVILHVREATYASPVVRCAPLVGAYGDEPYWKVAYSKYNAIECA